MRAEPKGGMNAPALAAALAGLLLALVLPNPLLTPSTNVQTQAEYAPVPGRAPNVAAANFGQTQTTSSKGIGELPNAFVPNLERPALPEFMPRMKECVGDPPRQTEDPMSPPCVPFFDGPNGGKTWQGVTKDRIEVVMYVQSLEKELDLSEPWKPSDESAGAAETPEFQYNLARTLKAHYRYFQQRYQTYGREVRVRAIPQIKSEETTGAGGLYRNCEQEREEAREAVRSGIFAGAYVGYWQGPCFRSTILRNDILFFGVNYDVAREDYDRNAPLLWGFFWDQETGARLSASFLCRSLKGGKARFANDPDPTGLTSKTRRFAVVYERAAGATQEGSVHEQIAKQIVRAAHGCGVTVEEYPYQNEFQDSNLMVRLKQDGITTLIMRGISTDITFMQNKASSIGYFPEWFWEQPMAVSYYGNTFADRKQSGFGISPRWRHPAYRQQVHYRAYKSMEPGSTPNGIWSADIYYTFQTLFSAIQSAGPQLTPANVEAGMFTLNLIDLDNPWVPSGGWGRYGPHAVNNYTFVDTAMAWWGDFQGQQPGGAPGEGCFRASLNGRRFFAGKWPRGDDFLYRSEDPCYQGDIEGVDDR